MPWKLPGTDKCCGCVTDLKTAVAIIAVLGIVTSPSVSWAVVRHSYMIRVSCFITTSETRPDIVDINLNNILSFGFGANAGLGPSCLGIGSNSSVTPKSEQNSSSSFITAVKYIGWIVLLVDVIFVMNCICFFLSIFKGTSNITSKYFIWTASFSIIASFIYGLLFVTACVSTGGMFPIFEFLFTIVDVMVWFYFLIVVQSYRRLSLETTPSRA